MTDSEDIHDDRLWTQRCGVLLLALFALRVTYLAIVPLELCPDEAYYWDWSRQLDWGYYSKPPMIAWIIACATGLGGHSEFAVRLPAAILGTLGLWAVFGLGRSLFNARVGFWTAVAVAATPGMAAMSLLMTIDAPFLCCWAFAVWCVWELFGGGVSGEWVSGEEYFGLHHSPTHHSLFKAILCTGLGLLSKQTMLAIFPLTLLWLASDATGRQQLRRPTVWIWVGASLLFLTPVVWWNWQHGWITVQHTREHFQTKDVDLVRHLTYGLEFWAGQFGVASPITCGLMMAVGLAALATWCFSLVGHRVQNSGFTRGAMLAALGKHVFDGRRTSACLPKAASMAPNPSHLCDRRVRFILCLSAIPMLGVTGLSLIQRVQPNWPASFHLTAFVLLAAWACGAWDCAAISNRWRRGFPLGVAVGAAMVVGVYVVPFAVPGSSLAGGKLDATARLRGWKALGLAVGDKLREFPQPDETLMIAATSRGPVSALAYYVPGHPHVYRWNPTGLVESQHDIWGGPRGRSAEDALIVTHRDQPVPADLAAAFDQLACHGPVQVHLGGSRSEVLTVWRGTGYRGWPEHNPSRVGRVFESHHDGDAVTRPSGMKSAIKLVGLEDSAHPTQPTNIPTQLVINPKHAVAE